jgi:hypothetical protein
MACTPVILSVGGIPITPAGLGTQQAAMLRVDSCRDRSNIFARRKTVSHPISSRLVWLALLVLALGALPRGSAAQPPETSRPWTPVQLALWDPIQVFGEGWSVAGLRLSLISGANHDVTGLDLLGIASLTRGDQTGLQIGLYEEVEGDLAGWQLAAFAADVDGRARGLQTAALYNHAGEGTGVQLSGALNRTERMRGLQISLVNWTEDLEGVQIGLVNIHRNGWIPFLPVFNFGF